MNRKYAIAVGKSRFERTWRNEAVTWEWLRERLSSPSVTPETMAEYRAMGRDRQTQVKDVGGFVGGYLDGGRRSAASVRFRDLATLDYDDFDAVRLSRLRKALAGTLWMVHSTHKHREEAWRVRVVIALGRGVSPDEYGAVSRKLAERIGFDGIDRSTFEPCRLMFWPSRSTDGPYLFEEGEGKPLDVDSTLGEYEDWRDMSAWPMLPEEERGCLAGMTGQGAAPAPGAAAPRGTADAFAARGRHGRQEDPLQKRGIVGAWCRSYGIHEAIAAFLPEVYKRCGESRYSHAGSSTTGGAWVLEGGRFLYSFHGTDPAQGRLLNSWDLVRVHRFGDLDIGVKERKTDRLPSFKAMEDLALDDSRVKERIWKDRAEDFREFWKESEEEPESSETSESSESVRGEEPESPGWEKAKKMLKMRRDGTVESTITSAQVILEHHPAFRGKLRANLFTGNLDVEGRLPWRRFTKEWTNSDDSALRGWLDRRFGISGDRKISDALTNASMNAAYHPVRDYLGALEWDGEPRLERLVIDAVGAEDTELNRELTKLIFTAACRRVFEPGCKFDYLVILQGPEGCGKSSLFSLMTGKDWFSDSVVNIEGKDGMDALSGVWIAEMGELVGIKRSEMTSVKSYVSRQTDKWRPAYKPRTESHPRECVLVGTTNDEYFIRGIIDKNRRFPVIECRPELRRIKEGVWGYVPRWRDQLWGEAMAYHRRGDPIWLPERFDEAIRRVQDPHNLDVSNPVFTEVDRFLDAWLPGNWETMGVADRRMWWQTQTAPDEEPTVFGGYRRDTATIAEIMRELLGKEPTDRDYRSLSREVGQYMQRLSDVWEPVGPRRTRLYGNQKTWQRKKSGVFGSRGDPLQEL